MKQLRGKRQGRWGTPQFESNVARPINTHLALTWGNCGSPWGLLLVHLGRNWGAPGSMRCRVQAHVRFIGRAGRVAGRFVYKNFQSCSSWVMIMCCQCPCYDRGICYDHNHDHSHQMEGPIGLQHQMKILCALKPSISDLSLRAMLSQCNLDASHAVCGI